MGSVSSVAFSPDGKYVLTGSSDQADQTARLWETSNARELIRFQGHTGKVSSVTFSPDSCIAITCDAKGWVYFWRIDDLKAEDPLTVYVAYYPVVAIYWQDKTHVILADNGGPRNYPYFYYLELEGMG
jgi:WD40 repeat protein